MRARKHAGWAALTLAMAAALPVSAAELGYTYAEARYLDVDLASGAQADGFTAIGWYRVTDDLFAIGQVTALDVETGAEVTAYTAGGGYIMPLNDEWDAVVTATAKLTQTDLRDRSTEDDGYGAQFGFRGMPIPKFEARAFVNYVKFDDDTTSLLVSGDYFFSPVFCAGVAFEVGEDTDTISVGARYAFGF
jgi:hypothetical protein